MSDFDDPLARLRADIDQWVALAPELARAARGLFNAYVSEGFSERQALYLTVVHLQSNPGNAPS